ncbi:Bifunctional polymyxin resistance protein ArnA [Variovorax sp. PBS-H4]|uniref:formyltransferase n=1 Tax=Variovorax sp. PBS-H4 TaxID=434008 RepID=UPI001316CC40|nr:formyltransferase [Variovorax sp. PBS-H4]VTU30640.1 Bifunctional polymyxin resistance protein ArnA [Variovorax sp. PBS-H4]
MSRTAAPKANGTAAEGEGTRVTGAARAPRAIVFAYHDVGVRCLRVLLDAGVEVPLVVTHADAAGETIWFRSVASTAAEHGLRCVTPADPHEPALLAAAREAEPDFLFSFYYRQMLKPDWLQLPRRGAYNMHGSLLPHYRGRAPVNWAVIHGERETGATLHRMNEKPDNGPIVDQFAVPILSDDTAHEVFGKVTVAAEIVLARSLPGLLAGSAAERPQDLSQGGYFGGRRPEDGRIPAHASAREIHNLVRALAPPYPCAFLHLRGLRVFIERTRPAEAPAGAPGTGLRLLSDGAMLWLIAADGSALQVLAARGEGSTRPLDARGFEALHAGGWLAADA